MGTARAVELLSTMQIILRAPLPTLQMVFTPFMQKIHKAVIAMLAAMGLIAAGAYRQAAG